MKLEVKNLHKSFEDREVLHGITFSIESGRALGLLGRNGAGKTTTIRILMDVFQANQGEVLLDGQKFVPSHYQIGYMPEERGLYPKKKVAEQILYLAALRGVPTKQARENLKALLRELNIEEYENRKLDTLSKGNQQKVQLVQTLVCNPDIVILDEPFSGLDPVNSQLLKEAVQKLIAQNKLVIFSSHQMSYVEEFCEDIVILNHGDVVLSGNLKQIKKEFGKNQLILNFSNCSPQETEEIVNHSLTDLTRVKEVKKQFVVLELIAPAQKKDVLARLTSLAQEVEIFGDYEPALTDIFVQKAGDEA